VHKENFREFKNSENCLFSFFFKCDIAPFMPQLVLVSLLAVQSCAVNDLSAWHLSRRRCSLSSCCHTCYAMGGTVQSCRTIGLWKKLPRVAALLDKGEEETWNNCLHIKVFGSKVFTSNSFGRFCGVSEYQLNVK